jgi:hypothetical protein
MAWKVDTNTTLGPFLRLNHVQPWRVPILSRNGGVKVVRNRSAIAISNEKTALRVDDQVSLVTPLPTKCQKALQNEANSNWRDYAIVPGTSPFDVRIADFLKVRPNTVLLTDPSLASIQAFLEGLRDSDEIKNPIRRLIIVGHANVQGVLKVPLYRLSTDPVSYEDLEDAVNKRSLIVDMNLLTPRPVIKGVTEDPILLLLGCTIGAQSVFMKKMKDALGGKITVIAPKHFLVGAGLASPPGKLVYMAYDFAAVAPKMLADKKAVIAAMHAKQYDRENGTKVPLKMWDKWLPDDVNAKPDPLWPREIKNNVVLPVFGVVSNAPRRYALKKRKFF